MASRPGFRFSKTDGIVLAVLLMIAGFSAQISETLAVLVLLLVGHFFLFCNVIRMNRSLELIWAVIFLGLSITTLVYGVPELYITVLISFLISIVLTIIQMRRSDYHGVLWDKINGAR